MAAVKELLGSLPASGARQSAKDNRPADEACKLSEVAQKYRAEKMLEGAWRQTTLFEHAALHEMLVEYLGNVDVATVRHKEAVAFKDVLLALPSNMRKKFPGKTIRQVLATGQQERMGIKTVNEKLQRLSSLFGWAERHGYCQKNPLRA